MPNHLVRGAGAALGDMPLTLEDFDRVADEEIRVSTRSHDVLMYLQDGGEIDEEQPTIMQHLCGTLDEPPGFGEI